MFERFTDRARRVVVLAQEEARLLNHNYIGTEHLLLGLIREGEGVAAKALKGLGISLELVRLQIEGIIGQGQQAPSGHIPFTPRAKRILELSLREALQLGHNYIGTEHILLGLLREGEGVAAQVLVRLGADLNRVRQQVIQVLHGTELEPVATEPGARASRPGGPRPIDLLTLLRTIDERLAAIERHLGLRPTVPTAGLVEGAAAVGGGWLAGATSEAPSSSEPGAGSEGGAGRSEVGAGSEASAASAAGPAEPGAAETGPTASAGSGAHDSTAAPRPGGEVSNGGEGEPAEEA